MKRESLIGQVFGNYKILEEIASGGMATVYKALQLSMNRVVALKLLSKELSDDPAFVARFEREIDMLAGLNHPHIVSVFDRGKIGEYSYYTLEYVPGQTLEEFIKSEDRYDAGRVLRIVHEVAVGLKFAHRKGVIHRDIKPSNILLDEEGNAKISDFGIAHRQDQHSTALTQTGKTMGTFLYMAPEQLKDPRRVDQRADVYSLGVVFYELLTGEIPSGVFEPVSASRGDLAVDVDRTIEKMLRKDPNQRYATIEDFLEDLEKVQKKYLVAQKEDLHKMLRHGAVSRVTMLVLLLFGVGAIIASGNLGWIEPVTSEKKLDIQKKQRLVYLKELGYPLDEGDTLDVTELLMGASFVKNEKGSKTIGKVLETSPEALERVKTMEGGAELMQKMAERGVDEAALKETLKKSGIDAPAAISGMSEDEIREAAKAGPAELEALMKSPGVKPEDLQALKDLKAGSPGADMKEQLKMLEVLQKKGLDVSGMSPGELQKLGSGTSAAALRQVKAFERYANEFSNFLSQGDALFLDRKYLQAESAYRHAWRRANDLRSWQACLLIGERFITLTQQFKLTGGRVQTARQCFQDASRYALKERNADALEKVAVAFALIGEEQTADSLRQEAARIRDR